MGPPKLSSQEIAFARRSRSAPRHFQVVLDVVDALQSAQRFLRHLLLVKGRHRPAQHDAALRGFEAELAVRQIRTLLQGVLHAVVQSDFTSGRSQGGCHKFQEDGVGRASFFALARCIEPDSTPWPASLPMATMKTKRLHTALTT